MFARTVGRRANWPVERSAQAHNSMLSSEHSLVSFGMRPAKRPVSDELWCEGLVCTTSPFALDPGPYHTPVGSMMHTRSQRARRISTALFAAYVLPEPVCPLNAIDSFSAAAGIGCEVMKASSQATA